MIEPYLNLEGQAAEAMDFYAEALGGSGRQVTHLSDMPADPANPLPQGMGSLVAHGQMTICGTTVNFSDMQAEGLSEDSKISLMVRFSTPEELTAAYEKLQEGGQVLMELSPQPYGLFAWVRDRFGIGWQLLSE